MSAFGVKRTSLNRSLISEGAKMRERLRCGETTQ